MTRGAHDEHVAQALIEDDLGGHPAVGATEHHRGRPLRYRETGPVLDALAGVLGSAGDEPLVTLLECRPRCRRAGIRHGSYCALPLRW